jgi:3-phenylpropionate/trans-cinnamate dioxygenase ferredoxin subunit
LSDLKITITDTGSYKCEGDIRLYDHEGNLIETREGKPFFLCRCGQSTRKPFCDGTHNRIEWDGSLAEE